MYCVCVLFGVTVLVVDFIDHLSSIVSVFV